MSWDLGDGNSSNSDLVTHVYSDENTYQITLTAIAANLCEASVSHELNVWSNPTATFTIPEPAQCSPAEVCVQNTSLNASGFAWEFSDDFTSIELNPCHGIVNSTTQPQQYTIVLVAENAHGCTASATANGQVNPIPVSNFTIPFSSSCTVPITVNPDVLVEDEPSYEWQVNGEPVSGDVSPALTLNQTGAFLINLTVTNDEGCESSSEQTFVIYPEPVAQFSTESQLGCIDFEVDFVNSSIGATQYSWQFGDGEFSTEINPAHTYTEVGVFDVTLAIISEHGCTDTLTVQDFIQTYGLPVADFSLSTQETSIFYPEITVSSLSENADLLIWDFGDGGFIEGADAVHSYAYPGAYEITLTVATFYGCQDSISRVVTITNEMMVFVPNSFTPDDDGRNDIFIPEMAGKEFITSYMFRVFDRWGAVIFETRDPFTGWIGNVSGGDYYAPAGVYIYELILTPGNSPATSHYSGNVTLIR
jgi:gliding motility-associated-like protein